MRWMSGFLIAPVLLSIATPAFGQALAGVRSLRIPSVDRNRQEEAA